MTMMPRQETAKIYQFPVKGRDVMPGHRTLSRPVESYPAVASDFGSGWYHESAMQDAERSRKH